MNNLTTEVRPWGNYIILFESLNVKVKRIIINSGQAPSYQYHYKRMEHWIVVKGTGILTLDDIDRVVNAGESIFIPRLAKHQLKNTGIEDLEFIEVQTGEYFGEDDIVRIKDNYGRIL